ncbi:MAG: pacearchaeosortase [Candidatus Woesearchaeota archaeon]
MKKNKKEVKNLIIRYFLLLVFLFIGLKLVYFIFEPLTRYPVYWLLDIFYNVSLSNSIILFPGLNFIEIAGACIAGSAYLLFLILNLSTPKISLLKRLKLLGIAFGSFLILNIIRIFILGILVVRDSPSFSFVHSFFWYFLSIIFVVGIWFFEVKKFNIKHIPFYSDIMFLLNKTRKEV